MPICYDCMQLAEGRGYSPFQWVKGKIILCDRCNCKTNEAILK